MVLGWDVSVEGMKVFWEHICSYYEVNMVKVVKLDAIVDSVVFLLTSSVGTLNLVFICMDNMSRTVILW